MCGIGSEQAIGSGRHCLRSEGVANQANPANHDWFERQIIAYPEGEAELRLLRVEFPIGGSVPLHTHPAPLIAYVSQGQIRHTRGDQVNTFGPGQAFVESDQGGPHTVENIGEEPAVVFVAVASKQGLPTTNFVSPAP